MDLGSRPVDLFLDTKTAKAKYQERFGYYATFIDQERRRFVVKKRSHNLFLPPPTEEQRGVLRILKECIKNAQYNNFSICKLTARAGAGKTYVLLYIERYLMQKGMRYAYVAPTAAAASILPGGLTVHSLLGIYNVKQPVENLLTERLTTA